MGLEVFSARLAEAEQIRRTILRENVKRPPPPRSVDKLVIGYLRSSKILSYIF